MKVLEINNEKGIRPFVLHKIQQFEKQDKTFAVLFGLMFREKNAVMYESSHGYRMEKKTYGEVKAEILRRTASLRERFSAYPAGSVIGLDMENSLDWIELFWAILAGGYQPLLINRRLQPEIVEKAISDMHAVAVISADRTYAVETTAPDVFASAASAEMPAEGAFGESIFVMSSGTSRHLKICAYTAEEFYHQVCGSYDIICHSKAIQQHYNGSLKLLTFLPFYHVFGLIAVYIWFAFFSRTFVQLNDMSPITVQNTIKRHQVTHVFAVPLFWETVYDRTMQTVRSRGKATEKKLAKGLRLGEALRCIPPVGNIFSKLAFKKVRQEMFGDSICFMITGGSAIRRDILAFFNTIGYPLANGYGMTEVGITSVELSEQKQYRYEGFAGKPMAHTEYQISPDGELLVRGAVTAHAVFEDGDWKENGGWYNTHDLAEEKNGHYRILARKDDIIIPASGENLNPHLAESRFVFPHIRRVCLIPTVADGKTVPVLLISAERFLGEEAFRHLQEQVQKEMTACRLPADTRVFYTADPLLAADEFKLNRQRLAQDYADGKLHPITFVSEDEEGDSSPLLETVKALMAASLNREGTDIPATADYFTELGGTSLSYFTLVAALQEELGVSVPRDAREPFRTAKALADYVQEEKNRVD